MTNVHFPPFSRFETGLLVGPIHRPTMPIIWPEEEEEEADSAAADADIEG